MNRNGKIRKNKLNYYFLTELGQKLFDSRFGESILMSPIKDREILEVFRLGGWMASLEEGILAIEKNGKGLKIVIQKNNDRQEIAKKVKKYSYFICGTDNIRNIVLQEAAKTAKPTLFIATDKEFEEEGTFEKVQFQHI